MKTGACPWGIGSHSPVLHGKPQFYSYALNALDIDKPLEYIRLYLEGNMQMWIDSEDSLELR